LSETPTLAIRPSTATDDVGSKTSVQAAVKTARIEDARIAAVSKEAASIQRVFFLSFTEFSYLLTAGSGETNDDTIHCSFGKARTSSEKGP
jgi:hypothetical protein